MLEQRTIEKEVSVTGIGIHSGKKVTLRLLPAPIDHGVVFDRVDLPGEPIIKAHALNVGATENNTSIGSGINTVYTVEHLLSVLCGLGIDNVVCELDGRKFLLWMDRVHHFVRFARSGHYISIKIKKNSCY